MLTRSGFAVLAASNEVEAVRLLGERRSETVAALVGLAGADPAGLRLPGRLREVRKDLPIVMLSDLPEDEVRARVDLGDGVRFLRWPCAREDLAAALRDLLAPPGPA
jgi:DNA-binding response OmpR family regulator